MGSASSGARSSKSKRSRTGKKAAKEAAPERAPESPREPPPTGDVPADLKDRIFDRFETHSRGSRHRGAGLGLSIVRSFVELHGGNVQVESDIGRGTTVKCIFPFQRQPERTAA